jgi:Aminotransferase class-III
VPNTNIYRAPIHGDDPVAFGRWAADKIEVAIENEGADTVAAVFLEPVQNAGGCFPPPPGYFQRVREICDRHDVLLVSDEVICAFGRLGHMFGAERYGYQPDIITCAKGITSGYAPLGAMIATDRLIEPFPARQHILRARLHVRRSPGVRRRRAGQPRHLRARRNTRARAERGGAVPHDARDNSSIFRWSATSGATASSAASSW